MPVAVEVDWPPCCPNGPLELLLVEIPFEVMSTTPALTLVYSACALIPLLVPSAVDAVAVVVFTTVVVVESPPRFPVTASAPTLVPPPTTPASTSISASGRRRRGGSGLLGGGSSRGGCAGGRSSADHNGLGGFRSEFDMDRASPPDLSRTCANPGTS